MISRIRRSSFTSVFRIAGIQCSIFILLFGCGESAPPTVRVATYNASLNRLNAGDLIGDLATGEDPQARAVAEIVQRIRPDILLLNEFDYDADGEAARLLHDRYLTVSQHTSAAAIEYPYWYVASVNTGVPSGHDLDKDGQVAKEGRAYGGDALGFGFFPGQFGAVVYSRFPIDREGTRTFQSFLWRDMPGARLPIDPATGDSWYTEDDLAILPLSSKSHWDLPVTVDGNVVHLLISHPTPPVFDGSEDRNGRRNHDEIRFWHDYVTPGAGEYIYDDLGAGGGLAPDATFIIMGDQNADPLDGDSHDRPIRLLLDSPLINTAITPASEGGAEQTRLQGGSNQGHLGDPAFDTSDFGDDEPGPGNLRLDYVLPSVDLEIVAAGVFWPLNDDPLFPLIAASDHRLVWMDVTAEGGGGQRKAAGAARQ